MSDIVCRPVKNDAELHKCFEIRKKIFVNEQGLFDGTDRDEYDDCAIHLVAFHSNHIIGTVRIYKQEGNTWWGGRLAVTKRYRGRAGKQLVQKAMEIVADTGARQFYARVQCKNVPFFENLGWRSEGSVFVLHGRSHQLMEAQLKKE